MAAAHNLDGSPPPPPPPPSPPAMKKKTRKKKKEIETMAANSDRRRRASAKRNRRVYKKLIECEKLLGILLRQWEVDDVLDENDCHYQDNNNNSGRPKRTDADRSDNAARRRPYKDWSEGHITFDKGDCQDRSDLSGRKPIVVQPIIFGHRVHDVLMDGGSSLNIITAKMLDKMHISRSEMKPVTCSFQGVVSGISATSIGQILLSVQLGTPEKFRIEVVLFDVVDNIDIPFTAILGRPAIAKFMAVLHHAYQCAKIPGPYGVITLVSSGQEEISDDDA